MSILSWILPENISIAHTFIAFIVIAIASFIQSAIGFGLSVVSSPFLIKISHQYVPAPVTMASLFLALLNAYHYRKHIQLKELNYAIIGRLPGSILGGLILNWISADQLTLFVGCTVLIAVLISLLPYRFHPTKNRFIVAGFFSGVFGTSTGIGGPPMALLMQHQKSFSLRANLSAFFIISSLISIIVQFSVGHLTLTHVQMMLPLLPGVYIGYWLAKKTVHHLSDKWLRYSSLTICFISGFSAIINYMTLNI